jgi:hypothetical protein
MALNKKEEDDGILNYSILSSQDYENIVYNSPTNKYIMNFSIHVDMIEINLQHNFQDFICPSLDIEMKEVYKINANKNKLYFNISSQKYERYETNCESFEDSYLKQPSCRLECLSKVVHQ